MPFPYPRDRPPIFASSNITQKPNTGRITLPPAGTKTCTRRPKIRRGPTACRHALTAMILTTSMAPSVELRAGTKRQSIMKTRMIVTMLVRLVWNGSSIAIRPREVAGQCMEQLHRISIPILRGRYRDKQGAIWVTIRFKSRAQASH